VRDLREIEKCISDGSKPIVPVFGYIISGFLAREIDYSSLLDNLYDWVYLLNHRGYFVFANRVIEQGITLPLNEFIGRHYLDLVSPKDHELVRTNFEGL
jgi:PAS domain-containing protein